MSAEDTMNKTKKLNKKLFLDATTLRVLRVGLDRVVGGMGPQDSQFWACHSDEGCGGSHAATCGDGSRCA
jgi:hypothetical protein